MNVAIITGIKRVGQTRDGTPTWRIQFSSGPTRLTKRGSQVGLKVDESWLGRVVMYDVQYVTREGTRIVNINHLTT